jgi:hypothetical protein
MRISCMFAYFLQVHPFFFTQMQVSRRCGSDNLQVRQASDFSTQGVAEWLSLPAHRELGERVHACFYFYPIRIFIFFIYTNWLRSGAKQGRVRHLYIYTRIYISRGKLGLSSRWDFCVVNSGMDFLAEWPGHPSVASVHRGCSRRSLQLAPNG